MERNHLDELSKSLLSKPKLTQAFFNRSTTLVAKELLGKVLCFNGQVGIITETEAYLGEQDPASHASKGRTPRTEIMFGPAGYSYVYLIYGMYHCLNFVTEKKDVAAAVLIRGLFCLNTKIHYDGPGKLCRAFGITREQNNQNVTDSESFCLRDNPIITEYETTTRIGIKVGVDRPWRYVIKKPESYSF